MAESVIPTTGSVPMTIIVDMPTPFSVKELYTPCGPTALRRSQSRLLSCHDPTNKITIHGNSSHASLLQALHHEALTVKEKLDRYTQRLTHLEQTLLAFRPAIKRDKTGRSIGYLDFVGDGLSWLFGTASQKDLKKIYDHLGRFYDNITTAGRDRQILHRTISKLAKLTDNKINNLVTLVNSSTASTNKALRTMERQLLHLYESQKRMTRRDTNALYVIENALNLLRTHISLDQHIALLDNWYSALKAIAHGKLPSVLVPEDELHRALDKANQFIQQHIAPELHVSTSPGLVIRLYELSTTRFSALQQTGLFILQVPVVIPGHAMDVYQVKVFPAPVHSSSGVAQQAFTKLTNMPDYFAITKDGSKFMHFDYTDYIHCISKEHGFCTKMSNLHPIADPSCAYAIYRDFKYRDLLAYCKFKLYNSAIPSQTIRISDDLYLFLNLSERLSIDCRREVSFVYPGPSVYAKVPCGCYIKGEFLKSFPAVSSCAHIVKNLTFHTVNFPLLALFDMHHLIPDMPTQSTSNELPVIDLPDVAKYFKTVANGTSIHKEILQFEEVEQVRAQKEANPFLTDMTLTNSPANLEPSSWVYHFHTIGAVLAILLMTLVIYCVVRLQKHAILLSTLIMTPPVHALRLTATPALTTLPTPTPEPQWIQFHASATVFAIVVVLTTAFVVFILLRGRKCTHVTCPACISVDTNETVIHLYLRLNKCTIFVISVDLLDENGHMGNYPLPLKVDLRYLPWPHLAVTWSEPLKFFAHGKPGSIFLPSRLAITWAQVSTVAVLLRHRARRYFLYRIANNPKFFVLPWIDCELANFQPFPHHLPPAHLHAELDDSMLSRDLPPHDIDPNGSVMDCTHL